MQQYEFHSPETEPFTNTPRTWKILEPGISQLTLNHDPSTGRATYLQRWSPGASNQIQNFSHEFIEEIVVIEGDLRDLKGRRSRTGEIVQGEGEDGDGDVWGKGAYAYREPGMNHGPFRSEEGCLMFVVVIPVETSSSA